MKSVASTLAMASIIAGVVFAQVGCTETTGETVADDPALNTPVPDGLVRGTVVETMDSGGYTYVLLDTGGEQRWLAGPLTDIAVGQVIQTPAGMAMRQFTSNTLNRTFDVLYFVSSISRMTTPTMPEGHPTMSQEADPEIDVTTVAALEPGKDIAWVYANKDSVAGQEVSLRGKVVKYNAGILGQNFIHIQDGSGEAASGTHDITVASKAATAVGETIVATGTIILDKDFGSGYVFPVMMEDASITIE